MTLYNLILICIEYILFQAHRAIQFRFHLSFIILFIYLYITLKLQSNLIYCDTDNLDPKEINQVKKEQQALLLFIIAIIIWCFFTGNTPSDASILKGFENISDFLDELFEEEVPYKTQAMLEREEKDLAEKLAREWIKNRKN